MNIDKILQTELSSEFNIGFEKERFVKMGGKLSDVFKNLDSLTKENVIEIIKSPDYNSKDEFLAILFWGIYFKVTARNNIYIQKKLVEYIESDDFESIWSKIKVSVLSTHSPRDIFRKFSKEIKIPGINYPYFTKIIFFYREANGLKTFPILDKWLCRAWCAVHGSLNNSKYVYDKFFSNNNNNFNGILLRKKSEAYQEYVDFMNDLAHEKEMTVLQLEQKLFGIDLNISRRTNTFNPRNEYLNWAHSKNINI